VVAHSEGPGKGAELIVRLPLDTSVPTEASEVGSARTVARRRILIIEDNVDAATSLCELLELLENEVEVAYDGPEGLAKARLFHPHVLLCDIGLPGMDGFDVARAFRADEALARTLLVALSGHALPEDLERAQQAGFQRHLLKPPSLKKLEQVLAEVTR
jgi:CheY-like chemotaxis protein